MMTLGEKLKNILAEQMDAERAKRRAAEEAAAIFRAKQRAERTELVSRIGTTIDTALRAGRIPLYKIYGTDQRSWINSCRRYETRGITDLDLWDNMIAWLRIEGLRIKVTEGWEGDGSRDWLEVSVELLPDQRSKPTEG